MKTQITNLLVALVATLSINAVANAQTGDAQVGGAQVSGQQQAYVMPPQSQNPYYFGMNLELIRSWNGTTLRVVSVSPGSPAQRAGLEIGDEIRTVNGRGFSAANDSFQAVSMMNQFVNVGGPAPAAAASAQAFFISPPPMPQPIAQMVVRNVRNGQDVYVTVNPTRIGGYPGPAPAAAASVGS